MQASPARNLRCPRQGVMSSSEPLTTEPAAPAPPARRPRRTMLKCLALGLLVILGVFIWEVEWFIIPSGSMAETLRGLHCNVTCADCGRQFSCGMDEPPISGKHAVCPNCGFDDQQLPL